MDVEHVKNMLMMYHTSKDEDVRTNSLKVLHKALYFSEEEQRLFIEAQKEPEQAAGWFSARFFW